MDKYENLKALRRNNAKTRKITIKPLTYGYQVHIGCYKIAVESKQDLMDCVSLYLDDPDKAKHILGIASNPQGASKSDWINLEDMLQGLPRVKMPERPTGMRADLIICDDIEEQKEGTDNGPDVQAQQ